MNSTILRLPRSLTLLSLLLLLSCVSITTLWAEALTMDGAASDATITITLSGGSTGATYAFSIYRDILPSFVPSAATLIATSSTLNTMPYVDHANLKTGVTYYYKVVAKAGDGSLINVRPAHLAQTNQAALPLSMVLKEHTINIVYLGDSITYGANLADPSTQAPPVICSACLRSMAGLRDVYFSNQGRGGHTTKDFLPGGGDLADVDRAAKDLEQQHAGMLLFTIMLGTNDSANSGTNGCPATPGTYHDNLKLIIDHLLANYHDARIFLNLAPWYSPNTHNGANYEETGLARLISYSPQLDSLVSAYANTAPGHVFIGDRLAFPYFSQTFAAELNPEHGANGTFFLHPNPQGAAHLGTFWALAILPYLTMSGK